MVGYPALPLCQHNVPNPVGFDCHSDLEIASFCFLMIKQNRNFVTLNTLVLG